MALHQVIDCVEVTVPHAPKNKVIDRVEIEVPKIYTGLPDEPGPRLMWTQRQRLLVCLHFKLWESKNTLEQIFNWVFRKEIIQSGFTDGFPYQRIDVMWRFLRDGRYGKQCYRLWKHIENLSPSQARRLYSQDVAQIHSAAQALNLKLEPRDHNSIRNFPSTKAFKEVTPAITSDSESEFSIHTDESEEESNSVQEITSKKTYRRTIPLDKTPMTADKVVIRLHSLPQSLGNLYTILSQGVQMSQMVGPLPGIGRCRRLLYRAYEGGYASSSPVHTYDTASGHRAGLFKASSDQIFVPPPYDSPDFERHVNNHLSDDGRTELTPFISFGENPRTAVYRASKFKHGMVAIIDLQIAENALRRRFPKAEHVYWICSGVVKRFSLELHGNYTGVGEYLIWGEVVKEAIVATICIEHIRRNSDLERMFQTRALQDCKLARQINKRLDKTLLPNVDFETGRAIGQFLFSAGIHHWRYLELVSTMMAMSCRFKGAGKVRGKRADWIMRASGAYEDYVNGVLRGAYVDKDGMLRPTSAAWGFVFGEKEISEEEAIHQLQDEANEESEAMDETQDVAKEPPLVIEVFDEGGWKEISNREGDEDEEDDIIISPGRKRRLPFRECEIPMRTAKRSVTTSGTAGAIVGWAAMAGQNDNFRGRV